LNLALNRLENRSIRRSIHQKSLFIIISETRCCSGRKITTNSPLFDVFIRFNRLLISCCLLYLINMEHVPTETSITILFPPSNQRHYKDEQYVRFLKASFALRHAKVADASHAMHYISHIIAYRCQINLLMYDTVHFDV